MAQALYDYWFVQFDFPDENGKPYKSSGGKMVWNEELMREIPEGWIAARIADVCDINSCTYLSQEKWGDVMYLDTSSITDNLISNLSYIDLAVENLPSRARRKVKHLDVIFSSVRPIQRHLGILVNPVPNMLVSTGFIVLSSRPNQTSPYAVFHVVKSEKVVQSMQKIGESATSSYPSIRPDDLANVLFPLPLPKAQMFADFDKVIAPLYKRMDELKRSMRILSKQRDFLLPLLMNGQVQVKPRGGELNYDLTAD